MQARSRDSCFESEFLIPPLVYRTQRRTLAHQANSLQVGNGFGKKTNLHVSVSVSVTHCICKRCRSRSLYPRCCYGCRSRYCRRCCGLGCIAATHQRSTFTVPLFQLCCARFSGAPTGPVRPLRTICTQSSFAESAKAFRAPNKRRRWVVCTPVT